MTIGNNTTGQAAVITWIYSGGTVNLGADYRSVSIKENVDTAEATAGADTHKSFISTVKSATIDYSGLMPAGGSVTVALAPGNSGTLIIAPEGTASGKVTKTYPCISLGPTIDTPYSDVVTVNCTFQSNGAWS